MESRLCNYYNECIKHNESNKFTIWYEMYDFTDKIVKNGDLMIHLNKYGNSKITTGVNIRDYIIEENQLLPNPDLDNHIKKHIDIYTKLTGLNKENLAIPDIFNITGQKIKEDLIIPYTAPRIGYYVHKMCSVLNKKKRNVVVEIGGGFGLGALFLLRRLPDTCYIIIDIPTTGLLSAYFLIKLGLRVSLFGEFTNINDTIKEYDIIILPQHFIKKLDTVDLVVNTASLTEMHEDTIKYYIKHINRISRYFYTDNHNVLNSNIVNAELINCDNLKLLYENETPINYMIPIIFNKRKTLPFTEEMYIRK